MVLLAPQIDPLLDGIDHQPLETSGFRPFAYETIEWFQGALYRVLRKDTEPTAWDERPKGTLTGFVEIRDPHEIEELKKRL